MNNSFAYLVGINKYREPGNDLSGCVNDMMDWTDALQRHGMPCQNMGGTYDSKAIRARIIGGLEALMKRKTKKHRLVIILDCCHSGTGTRDMGSRKARSIRRPTSEDDQLPLNRFAVRQDSLKSQVASPKQKHILLAACKSHQTAADSEFGGRANGAFTWSIMAAIQECGPSPRIHDVFMQSKLLLKAEEYDQTPVLEGPAVQREMPLFDDNTLYFIFSGHGSQVPDVHGDEYDKLDEIICPHDQDACWDSPLSDDVLRGILTAK